MNDIADAIASAYTSLVATVGIKPPDQTAANTAGNELRILAQKGNGTAAGAAFTLTAGQAGATGTGGAFAITSGAGGSTSGGSGAVALDSGAVTSGTAGTVTVGGTNAATTVIGKSGGTTTINGTITQNGGLQIVTHKLNPANTSGEFCFICDRAYTVISISEIHNVVAGQACALAIRKCTSAGTALADATAGASCVELLASTIDMTATAAVTQAGSLSAVSGAISLASGDKIGIKMGNGTSLVGGHLTIVLRGA